MKIIRRYVLLMIVAIAWFGYSSFAQTSHLWNIVMSFCNEDKQTNEIDLAVQAWEKIPMCVQFTNTHTQDLSIGVEFVDAVIMNNAAKNRACSTPDSPKVQFANFIQAYNHTIVLQAWATVKKYFNITYPIFFGWLSHGCLLYTVIDDQPKNQGMLGAIVRSAKFIDMFVSTGEVEQSVNIHQKTSIKKQGDEYVVSLWIVNKGNIDEKMQIKTTVSNILGFKKEFIFDIILPASTWITITSEKFILPGYGWPFRLSSKIVYTPEFNFNITDGEGISKIHEWGTKNIQNISFVRTRRSGIVIFFFLFVVWRNIRKFLQKNKKIHK